MSGLMIFVLVVASVYVIGGFIYAGANAMVDLNWMSKLIKSIKP